MRQVRIPIRVYPRDLPFATSLTASPRDANMRAFARFAAVGLASNAFLFLVYLLLTSLGLKPVLGVTLVWVIGVAITYAFNRSWTFRYTGAVTPALVRYGLLYAAAYALNILLLLVLVDHAGYPHALVQGVLIVLIAIGLFAAQRVWVFRKAAD